MASDSKGFYISHGNYEKNLLELLTTTVERYTDILLIVEGRKIRCHRFILALHSNFLKDLLSHEILEPTITIDGFSYEVVKATIGLIYTGQVATTLIRSHEIIELLQILGFEWFGKSEAGNGELQVTRNTVPSRSPASKISLRSSKKDGKEAPHWDEIILDVADDESENAREDKKPPRMKAPTVQTALGPRRSVSMPRRRKEAEIPKSKSPQIPCPSESFRSRASSSVPVKGSRRRRTSSGSSSPECTDSVSKRLRSSAPECTQSSVCDSLEIFRQLQKWDAKLAVSPRVVLNRLSPSQCELKPIDNDRTESNALNTIELYCAYCDLFFESNETFEDHQKASCTRRKILHKTKTVIGFVNGKCKVMRKTRKFALSPESKTCKFCCKTVEQGRLKTHLLIDCRSVCELCNNPIPNCRKSIHIKHCTSNRKAIVALNRVREEPSSRVITQEITSDALKVPDSNEILPTEADEINKNPQTVVRERSSTNADLSSSGEIMNQIDKQVSLCYCGRTKESGEHSDCYLLYFTSVRSDRSKCKFCAQIVKSRLRHIHFTKCKSRPLDLFSADVVTRAIVPATSSPVPNPVPNSEDVQLVDIEEQTQVVPAEADLTSPSSAPNVAIGKTNVSPTVPKIKIRSDLTDPVDPEPSTSLPPTSNSVSNTSATRFASIDPVRTYLVRKNPSAILRKTLPAPLENLSTRRIDFDPLKVSTSRIGFNPSTALKKNPQVTESLAGANFRHLGWIALPFTSATGPSQTTGQTPQLKDTISEKLSTLANQDRFTLSTLFANNQQAQQAPVGIVPPYNAFSAPDVELECHICGLVFKTKVEVNLHVKMEHEAAPEDESEPPQRMASPIFVVASNENGEQVGVEDSNVDVGLEGVQ